MSDISKHIFNFSEKGHALFELLLQQERPASSAFSAIPTRDRTESAPLSFAQERLWFLDQLEPGSSAYNMPLALRLTGRLDVPALEQSIGEILRRHEALRTTFVTEDAGPIQRTTPATTLTLRQLDLSAMPEQGSAAQQIASEEASRPFDLSTGPLLRALLLQLNPKEHVLLLTMHHIVSDGWSLWILCRELSALYEAFSQGNPSPLPELPIQYADFAIWQRRQLQGKRLEEQLMFWKEQLKDVSTLELPIDHPRPPVQTFCGAIHSVHFSEDLTEAIRSLSHKEGVTVFMTMLAVFQTLLHRYTGQEDIVVGTPIANRSSVEIEGLIGCFANTLVMRADTSGDPLFRDLLKRIRKSTIDAYAHQDLSFEQLVKELRPERDLSRHPLFQVMLALQNVPAAHLELPGLKLSRIGLENTRTNADLEVYLTETAQGLMGEFVYNTALFDEATIARMARHYQRLLEGIAANSALRLSELPLLSAAEQHQLLVEWNATATDSPKDLCIHELFEAHVERTPDALAVVFENQQLTYRELNALANKLAHYLRRQEVGPEVPVGICMERSLGLIIGILGILKAGGVYVPLDMAYPEERLAFMLEDASPLVILTQRRLAEKFHNTKARILRIDAESEAIAQETEENVIGGASAKNLAYVIYTSGSTGLPKGIAIEHRSAVNLVKWATDIYSPAELSGVLASTSICFDLSVFELFASLCNGGTVILAENVLQLASLPAAGQVTLINTVPSAMRELLRLEALPFSVQTINLAGEPLPLEMVQHLYQLPGITKVYDLYGPSETTTYSTFSLRRPDGPCTIGRPLANTQIYLLDEEKQPVPIAVRGELYIGGDGLARGYLNRPELTAERFLSDPFSSVPFARLYRTGDLARYLPDGNIEFLGRIDDQVKIRGFRIEPGETESVLGQHAAVRNAVVLSRDDRLGDKELAAYVVPNEKSGISTTELRTFLQEKLPAYMVPSTFVVLDSLPLTPNGKVDRRALLTPDHFKPGPTKTFVAPRNVLEYQLKGIWERVLGIEPIGVKDNFFELGGHSLLAVRLASEIKKMPRNRSPVMAIFQCPTIEQLAEAIQKEDWPAPMSSIVTINPGGSQTPLFWVRSTFPAPYMDPDRPLHVLTCPNQSENLALYTTATIQKIVSANLREIRSVQPEGPYILGGYCFWGVIALEIAQELLKQGDEVSLLCIVEPPPQCHPHIVPSLRDTSLKSRIHRHSGNLSPLRGQEKATYLLRKLSLLFPMIKRQIDKKLMKRKIKIALSRTYLFCGRSLPPPLRDFYLHDFLPEEALRSYIPRVYPGKVLLFQVEKELNGTRLDWNAFATGGVEVRKVSGAGHLEIVSEPFVKSWAEQLSIFLNDIETKRQGTKTEGLRYPQM
ncbi:MAG: amino acid adenylation domain-containing protein [Thermodesulfovibrionales bacterium]|jgi:aspartate racemase